LRRTAVPGFDIHADYARGAMAMEVGGGRGSVLLVRFLCELGLLAGLAYAGFTLGEGVIAWVFGLGAPTLAAVLWAMSVAPRARRPVPMPVRLVLEIDLFTAAAVALWLAGAPVAGVVLGVLGISSSVLNVVTAREGSI
jgi:hypothetical protein